VSEKCNSFYDVEYVKNNSYSYEQGIGKVFYFKGGNGKSIEKNEIINLSTPEITNSPQYWPIVRPTLELQIELLKRDINSIVFLNNEERDKQVGAVNEIIRSIKEQINTYKY
jgi:hypothetical protein